MAKINIETIQDALNPEGWSILSDKYQNLDTELIFECPEGHKVFDTWKKMRTNLRCPICEQNIYKKNSSKSIKQKRKGVNRTLALDQATRITGYSIFDDQELIHYGVFESTLNDEIARDNALQEWLINAIAHWKPDYIGIEGIQLQQNLKGGETVGVTTFETLARLQGILMLTCYQNNVPYKICPSGVWRKSCGIKGRSRADRKKSAQLLVKQNYDITVSNDEADAILIGRYVSEFISKNTTDEIWE